MLAQCSTYRSLEAQRDHLWDLEDTEFSSMKYSSFDEYKAATAGLQARISALSRRMRLLQYSEDLVAIPDYGRLYPIADFVGLCCCGGFTSNDGDGRYATAFGMSDIFITVSDVMAGEVRLDFTHVVWFNR